MSPQSTFAGSIDQVRRTAGEVFVAGFPLVLVDAVRQLHPLGLNRILHLPANSADVAPGLADEDVHTVATTAWIDLSAGPLVLQLPDMQGRYFNLALIDTAGATIAGFGPRTGHGGGGEIAIAGPTWQGELPGRLTAVKSPSEQVWAIVRISANSAADRKAAETLAERQSLARLEGGSAGAQGPMLRLDPPTSTCIQRVADLEPDAFLQRFSLLIDRAPGRVRDAIQPINASVSELLGIFDEKAGSPSDVRDAVRKGFADAFKSIRDAAQLDPVEGTWRARCGAEPSWLGPLMRAARAYRCLGAPPPADIHALVCQVDESSRPLHGSERYRIHFAPEAGPPVEAFWSLTTTPRPVGQSRTSLGDRQQLTFNRDGSLDLLIQTTPPAEAWRANWLPAPAGRFVLSIHLLWPKPAALGGSWRMPPVERLGSGFARRTSTSDRERSDPSAEPPPDDELRPRRQPPRRSISAMISPRLALCAALAIGLAVPVAAAPGTAAKKAAPAPNAAAASVTPESTQALKRMSAYLSSLSAFQITSNASIDLVLDDGEKIQMNGVTTYKVKKPDGFVISTAWDRKARDFIYDGKHLTIYAPKLGYYASVPAPSTIRETLKAADERFGIELPLADLFRWAEPGGERLQELASGFLVGPATLNGVETEQFAFRQGHSDWQIWIKKGDQPLPVRVVIVDREDPAHPQFVANLDWDTRPSFSADTFTFKAPADAHAIRMAQQ